MKKRFNVIVLLVSIITTMFCAKINAQGFPDVSGKPYEQQVETLRALGILMGKGEENFDPDGTMTRAEMATIALKLTGYGYIEQRDTKFADVPKSHWASGIIGKAYELGYISGVSETSFMPDAEISYIDAATILVGILGYDGVAENYGGYPNGYSKTAMDIGLFEGVYSSQSAAPRWAVAVMAYNALEIKLFDVSSYGHNAVYSISDETILSKYLKIAKVEGVVTHNAVTSITAGEQGLAEGSVKIAGENLKAGSTDVSDYLGYYVTTYYRNDFHSADDREIKVFFVKENKTKVLELEYNDEMRIVHSGNELVIDYRDDDKNRNKSVTVSDSSVIYNGMRATPNDIDTYFLSNISGRNFDIKLIDNTDDNKYDVAIITDYSSHMVVSVNVYDEIIRLKKYIPSQMEYMNLVNCEYTIYDANGNKMELSDIETNSVVTFVQSLNGRMCNIYVSNATVQGVIKSIEDNKCVINTEEYSLVNSLAGQMIQLKLEVLCYLDVNGKIAGYEEIAITNSGYGLLMNVNYDANISGYSYKILTNGGIKNYYSEQEIKAYNPATGNIEKTAVSSLIYTAPVSAGYTNPAEQYMLWYTDNSANFIEATKLTDYTAPFYSNLFLDSQAKSKAATIKPIYFEVTPSDDKKIRTIYVPDAPGQTKLRTLNNSGRYSYTYRSNYQMVFDSENNTTATPYYKVDSDAIVFSVLATDYTDENYSASIGTGKLQNGIANKMRLYATDTSDYASLIVNYSVLPDELLANMPYVVVKNIGVDNEDNLVLNGYSEGKPYTATIKDGTRLIERKPNLSLSQYTNDTQIKNSNVNVGTSFRLYDAATSSTMNPVIENSVVIDYNTLKKGDVIIVGKNGGTDVCYVEMAMRAADGVMLITSAQSSYYGRLSGADSLVKGVVTGISDNNEFLVESFGEYNSENRRQISEAANYRYTLLYHDRDMPYNFNKASNLWLYDYSDGTMTPITEATIQVGDTVMIRGAASAPKDCIVLRNYPF